MSYTKQTFKTRVLDPINKIHEKTIEDNDFTLILNHLNIMLEIGEQIANKDLHIKELWNEINADIISSVHAASSGFYRLSIISLRSVLELACHSFFYLDHKIEYVMFKEHDLKADKYVSTLVNEYMFFTTKYIQTFFPQIKEMETSENSVSIYLKNLYGDLSDIVHGRYKSLTKKTGLSIKYEKSLFKLFESKFFETLNIIIVMYCLRFNDFKYNNLIRTLRVVNL